MLENFYFDIFNKPDAAEISCPCLIVDMAAHILTGSVDKKGFAKNANISYLNIAGGCGQSFAMNQYGDDLLMNIVIEWLRATSGVEAGKKLD